MQKKKYLLISVLVVLIAIIGYALWANVQKQKTIEKENVVKNQKVIVNIAGLKGISSIGMIKMFEDKPSLGENYESKYQVAQSPDILVSKLLSKEFDFAALPTNVAAKIYNKNAGYKLAAMSSWGVFYVLSSEDNIKSWSDFKGKSINISDKGATPDIAFRYLAVQNNLDPEKDVSIDYTLGHVELAQAMIAGRVKLALLPEPFVTMVLTQNKNAKIVMNIQDEWKKVKGENTPFAVTCLVVKDEFAKNHPDAVEKFLNEYQKSIQWVSNNPAQAGTLVEKHDIGMKAKVAEIAIPRSNLKYEDAQQAKPAIKEFLSVILEFSPKDIGGKLPDENFYYKK